MYLAIATIVVCIVKIKDYLLIRTCYILTINMVQLIAIRHDNDHCYVTCLDYV